MSPAELPNQRQAIQHLQSAYNRWAAAWQSFDDYPVRLRDLAAAADAQRKACLVAELADLNWQAGDAATPQIPTELRPGSRPGAPSLWTDFDAAIEGIGQALAGDGYASMGSAFGTVAKASRELADQLEAQAVSASVAGKRRRAS